MKRLEKIKNIVLLGGGGHCRSCIDVFNSSKFYKVAGIIDNDINYKSKFPNIPFLGSDTDIPRIFEAFKYALVTVGQIKNAKIRKELFELIEKHSICSPVIQSKHSLVSNDSKIAPGSIIMHGAIVNSGAVIGKNVIVNSMALVEHDTSIGNHCHISTGVKINGGVKIGNECFIGSGAIIYPEINIGSGSVIAAGKIVKKNIGKNEILR